MSLAHPRERGRTGGVAGAQGGVSTVVEDGEPVEGCDAGGGGRRKRSFDLLAKHP